MSHSPLARSESLWNLPGFQLLAPLPEESERVLNPEALVFLARLERKFRDRRTELLQRREEMQRQLDVGWRPAFLQETVGLRGREWKVARFPRRSRTAASRSPAPSTAR